MKTQYKQAENLKMEVPSTLHKLHSPNLQNFKFRYKKVKFQKTKIKMIED
jgi:hypothetical protein